MTCGTGQNRLPIDPAPAGFFLFHDDSSPVVRWTAT